MLAVSVRYPIIRPMSRSINWINPSPPKRLLGVQVPHGTHILLMQNKKTSLRADSVALKRLFIIALSA